MAAAQDGDNRSYERLLREITPYIRALVRQQHRSPDRADDVVQEVLLSIHRVRHTYDPGRPFKQWLTAIARRRSIDAVRRRIRENAVEIDAPLAYETYADPDANKDARASEAAEEIASALDALSPGQRQALELLKLKEMSLKEAAAITGQSEGSLKVGVHRAIKSLRARLAREGER
ncbi:sigma-70 family RNA polymerase sigma factor [Roseiterribacter gracilis]